MVARLSIDRPKYEPYRATIERALATAERSRARLMGLADEDARAYASFSAARKLPHDTPEQEAARAAATADAARAASEAPMEVVRECLRVIEEVAAAAGRSNVNAASDLEVAARLSAAAAHGAAANVLINLPMVGDERFSGVMSAEVNETLHSVDRGVAQITQILGSRTLREPEPA